MRIHRRLVYGCHSRGVDCIMKRHLAAAVVLSGAMAFGVCTEADAATPAEVLNSAVAVGNAYWATHEKGPNACESVQVVTTHRIHHRSGVPHGEIVGWTDNCTVQIRRWVLFIAWRWPSYRRGNVLLCELVTHELGHAYGLEHTPTGIMGPFLKPVDAPSACVEWAHDRRLSGN